MNRITLLTLILLLYVFSFHPLLAKEPILQDTEILAHKMIKGVDIIKLVLYKVLTEDYSDIYKNKDLDYCKNLAAASVNEIFNCHNEKTSIFFNNNNENIVNGIINLGEKHPDLKRPITDALRVYVQANWMLSGNIKYYTDLGVFQNAMDRGIFVSGGDPPEPSSFLEMVEELAKKYELN